MTIKPLIPMIAVAVLLSACGEKEQTVSGSYKSDQKAWESAASPYMAKNYKGNDKAAWETQMRDRIRAQNEYNRVE